MIPTENITPELARVHADIFRQKLGHLHNLEGMRELIRNNRVMFLEAMNRNINLFVRSLQPTDQERKIIRMASAIMKDPRHKNAYFILEKIREYEKIFGVVIQGMIDPGTKTYKLAVDDITQRMTEAWQLHVDGYEPIDNCPDPELKKKFNHAIFYPNKKRLDQVHMEGLVLHFICRMGDAWFGKDTMFDELVDPKDWAIDLMGSRMFLDKVGPHDIWFNHFYNLWKWRAPFGLGWLSDDRLVAYQEASNEVYGK